MKLKIKITNSWQLRLIEVTGAILVGIGLGYWVVRPIFVRRVCRERVNNMSSTINLRGKEVNYDQGLYEECLRSMAK